MKKNYKKKEEKLTSEGTELRQPVAELEAPATGRKQAEETLGKIEVDKLAILNSVSELVAYQDTEHRIIWTNTAAAESVGMTPAQLAGRHCYEIWPQRNTPCAGCPVAKARQSGKPQEAEITTPEGRVWLVHAYPKQDATGNIIGVVEVTTDITERKKAEEALQDSEEFNLSLLANSPNPINVINPDSSIRYVNPALERMTGFSLAELIGRKAPYPYWAEETAKKTAENLENGMRRKAVRIEELFKKKNGEQFWVEITSAPVISNGKFKYLLANWVDITERKQAEEALRDSEEKTRKMFEAVSDGISVIDLSGTITEVNRRTVEMHGLGSRDELVGKSAFDIVAPRDREKIARNMKQALKRGIIRDQEYTLVRADGSEFPAELSTSALKDASGKAIGHITISRDITERKQAEEKLRESQDFSSSMLTNSPNPMLVINQDTSVRYVNPALEKLTGFSPKEVIGRKAPYPWWTEGTLKKTAQDMNQAMLQGARRLEELFHKKNGGRFWVEITSTPVTSNGEFKYYLANWVDITERKQAEEREKELQRELYLSSRLAAIGELAAGIAHQINNPLTGVLGFSQRLLRKSTDQETNQDLKRIYTEAERAAKVVQNLLTFARRRQPQKQDSNINEILESTLELRDYELNTSNIEVVTDLAPGLPEILLDFHQIQEVFLNIILNAEQAMTEANGGGKLTIKTEARKGYIRTTFTDNGPGIPAKSLEKIFDPFFSTKGEKGGTGLGLSVCHGIITEHDGRIYARSRPGKGATFFVELPVPEH